jgi:rfaE bifunctional protein kinase chain/domain
MNVRSWLPELLNAIPCLRIAVVGDFFLDKYLVVDPAFAEVSLETGKTAHQVVEIRCSPGAAGTVMNNLSALGVGRLEAVGVIGDNGEGYDLRRGLERARAGMRWLAASEGRFTPTYTKPMRKEQGVEEEMERLDIKNREPLPSQYEQAVLEGVRYLLTKERFHAVMIADQVQESNCGVITERVREGLEEIAREHPETLFFADSRVRIGLFRDVIVKPNRLEAAQTMGYTEDRQPDLKETAEFGRRLSARNGRPVFITLGADGIMACDPDRVVHVPALPLRGPIDIVGAGDSASAGITCALCAGASMEQAALVGNLCASVTIHKLGTTGTASPEELLALLP